MEGEEHDHRITSRMNLVDLAGSERCAAAHTCGERLKVDAVLARSGETCSSALFLGDYKVHRLSQKENRICGLYCIAVVSREIHTFW